MKRSFRPLRARRPAGWLLAARAPLAACLMLAAAATAQAIELGDASVLSQQGQRLKVAVPFGSSPGERVAVMRFAVTSVTSPDGQRVPAARAFTVSKPDQRNVVFLQSDEPVSVDRLQIEVYVANNDTERVNFDLRIPPQRFAQSSADPAQLASASQPKKRPVRRVAQRRAPQAPSDTAAAAETASLPAAAPTQGGDRIVPVREPVSR